MLVLAVALLGGYAIHGNGPPDNEQILYYDRNGDGKVDLEEHRYPGSFDRNWELRDDDYNGRYEQRVVFGYAMLKSAVDIPVPAGVKIEKKP